MLDLSEVRDATARLRRQEEFFRALGRRATDAGLVTSERGELVHASPALGRMLGYDDAAATLLVEGLDLVHPDDRAAAVAHFQRALVDDDPAAAAGAGAGGHRRVPLAGARRRGRARPGGRGRGHQRP